MEEFQILRCLWMCFDILLWIVQSQVALLASIVMKNLIKKHYHQFLNEAIKWATIEEFMSYEASQHYNLTLT